MNITKHQSKAPKLAKLSDVQLKGLTNKLGAKRNTIAETLLRACDKDYCYYVGQGKHSKDFDKLFAEHLRLNDYLQFVVAPEWQRRQVIN